MIFLFFQVLRQQDSDNNQRAYVLNVFSALAVVLISKMGNRPNLYLLCLVLFPLCFIAFAVGFGSPVWIASSADNNGLWQACHSVFKNCTTFDFDSGGGECLQFIQFIQSFSREQKHSANVLVRRMVYEVDAFRTIICVIKLILMLHCVTCIFVPFSGV